jgi:hypothetical protein
VRFLSDPMHMSVIGRMIDSVRTGTPAIELVTGMPGFEWFAKTPEYSEKFNDAMTSLSAAVIPAVLDAYDFSGIDLIADVAGGHGEVLMSILRKYPTMRGILTDVGHVIDGARRRIQAAGLADRCEAVAMDFFKEAPPGADAYVMKTILHDWDDERAGLILRNIHKAMGPKRGRVIVIDPLVPAGNDPDLSKLLDIEMLLWPGGRERTRDEFRTLFDKAGFELTAVVPTRSPMPVIEARKR